jgi:hypothetical protein
VSERTVEDIRKELADLEVEEERLSALRSRLHHQIDFGFESGTSREREREISDERRRVHERIDELRKLLGVQQVS